MTKKRYYRDFYGSTASISQGRRGGFRLRVRSGAGLLLTNKVYETFRGARIAMASWSDCWEEVTAKE